MLCGGCWELRAPLFLRCQRWRELRAPKQVAVVPDLHACQGGLAALLPAQRVTEEVEVAALLLEEVASVLSGSAA